MPRLLILLLLAAASAQAQPAKSQPRKAPSKPKARSLEAQLLWDRAHLLTSEILEDGAKLDGYPALILPARLAEAWSTQDPERASRWRQQVLDSVLEAPQNESAEHKQKRVAAQAALFQGVVADDPDTAGRLLDSMLQEIPNIPDPATAAPADADLQGTILFAILNGQMEIIQDQPRRALELAEKLFPLNTMVGGTVWQTYDGLRGSSDPSLADKFLTDAIAQAQAIDNLNLLDGLADMARPQPGLPAENAPPEEQRRAISQLIGQSILRVPQDAAGRQRACALATTASQLLPQMTPELQGQVQAAIDQCKRLGLVSPGEQHSAETLSKPPEEVLQDAAGENNARQRAMDKMNAAVRLAASDPSGALDAALSLSPAEQQAYPQWRARLRSVEMRALGELFRAPDYRAVEEFLDRVPDSDKPEQLLYAALRAIQARPSLKNESFALATLRQARELIARTDLDDNWRPCLGLLNRYAMLVPEEAPLVARESMACLNHIKTYSQEERKKRGYSWPPFGDDLRLDGLDVSVAGMDPQALEAAIGTLQKPADRVTLRLAVLRLVLQKYRTAVGAS